MKALLTVFVVSFTALSADAKPQYMNQLLGKFPDGKFTARCQTCHRVGPQLNPFGKDFFTLVNQAIDEEEGWLELQGRDSDGDGVINLDEILQNTNPGKAN